MKLEPGTIIKDRYILKEFKGNGSFGEVWLAHDEVVDTDVAIKLYISLDPRGLEEFKSEFLTTQGISHPNLLTTSYLDVWEQRPFLVMKYCPKGSSASLIGKSDESIIWNYIHDVAAGLNYLHNMPEPIIHQDIKPDNILIDDIGFVITDFGISTKIRSTIRKRSKRDIGVGATAYMGPERFENGAKPNRASDIWSLGASIFELATGVIPFNGLGGMMQRNGAEIPSLDVEWSKELNLVMQSCLAKEVFNRPTAKQLEEYSDAILKGMPATVKWNVPTLTSGITTSEDAEEQVDSEYVTEYVDESHSNTKRVWFVIGGIIVAVVVLILIWPTSNNDEDVIIPEETVDNIDTVAVEIVKAEPSDIPEVEPIIKDDTSSPTVTTDISEVEPIKKDEISSPTVTKKEDTRTTVKEEPKMDNNAIILNNALANGDYQQIQKLANQGYAAAYAPLAKYYLNNHDYSTAESYAKKAKAAGYSEGESIIQLLENLGYYD